MPAAAFDPHRVLAWAPAAGEPLRAALRWGSGHTGLPVMLVAAIAIVVAWRTFKRTLRFVVQVVLCVAALAVATRFGWITW
ncbi:MAG TPA: hypothetical protein VHS09_02400 [Polyangiaceae bacterium]|jgi:hypothetical protein|nr:hypothetical protein [Polyangiaceae bacterium]